MSAKSSKETILLIDSNALVHRAFHAFPQSLVTREGELVNAVYGFASLLLQALNTLKPDYVICVFDESEKTFRNKMYAAYKAHRPKTDEALIRQLDRVHQVVNALNIPVLTQKGFEADDIIGTLTRDLRLKAVRKIIMTGDRDMLQLVNNDTYVFMPGGNINQPVIYDITATKKKLGFKPELLIDFKGLRGDSSDNIPGVKGVGDKTATDLVMQYGELENIYKHLEELKPAVRKKLEAEKDMAFLSKKLATIKTDMKLKFKLKDALVTNYDAKKAIAIFQELEFKSLINRLPKNSTAETVAEQMSFPSKKTEYETKNINSFNFNQLKQAVGETDNVVVRFQREQDDFFKKPDNLGLATENEVLLIKISELTANQLTELGNIIGSKKLIGHNLKFDLHALLNLGVAEAEIYFDCLLAAYLINAGSGKTDLAHLAFNLLGIVVEERDQDLAKEAWLIRHLFISLNKDLAKYADERKWNLVTLLKNIELPLVKVLVEVERQGIILDAKYLQNFKHKLEKKLSLLEKEIYEFVGHEFNIASPKQMSEVLFGELHLPGGKKNKSGGFSTNERVLNKLKGAYPIINSILKYREVSKLKSTYTDALIKQIHGVTQRVHTTYNQGVAATGRLSSTNPNLQNIPISSELGEQIRKAFVADKNKMLVSFDYSQQELRLLAHISGEDKLKEAFKNNIDIHSLTASQLFGKEVEKIDKNERRVGKTVNFGVVYGISAFGLSEGLNIPREQAQQFIDSFFASYPHVREYFDRLLKDARELGFVETLFGRRKSTRGIENTNWQLRSAIEREVINFPLQGSAADMMKLAMIKTDALIKKEFVDYAHMCLQIHDQLVFEVAAAGTVDSKLLKFADRVKDCMLKVMSISVPMKVSVEVGKNLGEMSELASI